MKLALLGDSHSDNGMGIANKYIKRDLETLYDVSCSKETGILRRLWELCILVLRCDELVICSATLVNYPAVWLAQLQKKRIIYILHGLKSFESSFEHPPAGDRWTGAFRRYESYIMARADRTVCV